MRLTIVVPITGQSIAECPACHDEDAPGEGDVGGDEEDEDVEEDVGWLALATEEADVDDGEDEAKEGLEECQLCTWSRT